MKTKVAAMALTALVVVNSALAGVSQNDASIEVVSTSEVKWDQLNPARGDKSPLAGTLWGDRKGAVPTGFLVKFVDGFSSPPHIHNISYRAVVISGLIHNDDPDAADMWMPAGSFWTQPKGEVHITAAKGSTNVALVDIDEGPYLVGPPEEAFDSGERPINVDASNIVWIDQPGMPTSANGPKVAFLWGDPQEGQLNGTLVKLPAGYTGKINSQGSTFRAVVIQGQPRYQVSETDVKTLEPGSYFSSKRRSVHPVSSKAGEESIIYVRTDGKFNVVPAQPNMKSLLEKKEFKTSTTKNISRYPVPELNALPEDIKARIFAAQAKLGFIPNVLIALAHRPAEFRAFVAYNDALMAKESGLSAAEKQMLIVAHSSYNSCLYCVMSHGAALRVATGNPYLAEQVAVNYHEADITPREKAIIDFAMKVTKESHAIDEQDFETLRGHGLSDEDIWDVAGITAFFNLSNRMMNFAAIRADEEFYTRGR